MTFDRATVASVLVVGFQAASFVLVRSARLLRARQVSEIFHNLLPVARIVWLVGLIDRFSPP